jgi:hypothetical protein
MKKLLIIATISMPFLVASSSALAALRKAGCAGC